MSVSKSQQDILNAAQDNGWDAVFHPAHSVILAHKGDDVISVHFSARGISWADSGAARLFDGKIIADSNVKAQVLKALQSA